MADCLIVNAYYDPNIVGGGEYSNQLIAEGLPGRCDVLTYGRTNSERIVNGVRVREVHLPEYEHLWANPLDGTPLTVADKISRRVQVFRTSRRNVGFYRKLIEAGGYRTIIMNVNLTVMDEPSLWKGAHESGARVVLTPRTDQLLHQKIGPLRYDKLYRALVRRNLSWIDALVAPSQYILDAHANAGMTKSDRRVIPNSVRIENPPESVSFAQKSNVLFAGSIGEHKGIRALLDASRFFVGGERLELVGRGPMANECVVAGADVRAWMSQDELHAEMARAKVLVLPSLWQEAFGRVLVEAVLCGTLVVGSRVGGIPEVLNHDDRYLFPANDAEALAACVNRVLDLSEDEYTKELEDMRAWMARFSVERYVAAWRGVLDGVSA